MGRHIVIRQDIYIGRYDWTVRVYYSVTHRWSDEILDDLIDIGCSGSDLTRARRSLESGETDTGITYSNYKFRESVMVIARTSSPEEFQNSWDHEKQHLCRHIVQAFNIDPFGEEAAYLAGDIAQKMFPVARKFLCEHCRETLYRQARRRE